MDGSPVKVRHYMLLLYPDDTENNHKTVIDSLPLYDSVWIKHNKDVKENGEPLKEHIHAILSFPNARSLTSVAKELNLNERWVEPVRDVRQATKYLLHLDNKDKHHYSIEDAEGNVDRLRKIMILRRDVSADLASIFSFIDSDVNCNMRKVAYYCLEHDLMDVYVSRNMVIKNFLKG